MAVINTKQNYIFIHIYKTAGTSVREIISGTELLGVHCSATVVKQSLQNPAAMKNMGVTDPNFYENALKFAVVRHPYEWIGSTRDYILRHTTHRDYAETKDLDPYGFVEWERDVALHMEVGFGTNKHLTQKGFLYEGDECIVDHVLKQEELEMGMRNIFDLLEMEYPGLPVKNVGRMEGKKYRDTFDDRTKQLIQDVYGEDFAAFGYPF